MTDLRQQMINTARSAGINVIGRHKAAMLFALCLQYGDEPFVFNQRLHNDVMIAADTYGYRAMRVPDKEVAALTQLYLDELTCGASWVKQINAEYGTEFK